MKKTWSKWSVIIAGVIVGLVAVGLGHYGNPGNMQLCIACFIRDTTGGLGLQTAGPQYIRPELIGILLGAFIISIVRKEHAPKGGSSPLTRFILGVCVMVGALIFLGCPLRMVLRIAGGDLNAVVGLIGFVGGILTGIVFLNKGFSLKRNYDQPAIEGVAFPAINVLLLILLVAAPAFIFFSEKGPGAMKAPILISLAGGLIVGAVAQRSRLCFVSGTRDAVLFKDFGMLLCYAAICVVVLVANLISGKFKLGFAEQPIAHTEWLWNILGLYLVGFGSTLLGGCPMRQMILAGSGNSDSAITVLGFVAGAAISHNFGLASSAAGTTANGRVAFVICVAVVFIIAFCNTKKSSSAKGAAA
ncbi:MAG: YedE-related selenium metabolism membrane protein [Oscillospiraceae bacterium]|jgi:YedE family putative selenium metabolism protein|nr:YedE-related selenium metabolism membrane protein [Oscillospiraceae bacterium]